VYPEISQYHILNRL